MADYPLMAARPLRLADRDWIEPRLRAIGERLGSACPADISFTNMALFNAVHRYEVVEGAWPAVCGLTYDGLRHVLALFDLTEAPPDILRRLLEGRDVLYPLAAPQVAQLPAKEWHFTWQRSDADYLYAADTFLHYPGKEGQNKRRLVRQLLGAHEMSVRPLDADAVPAALDVLAGWLRDKAKRAGEADDQACRDALAGLGALNMRGWLHLADGQPVGWVLAEPMFGETWVARFAKGRATLPGLYPWMFQHLCTQLLELRWLNFEQDLGVAGLRRSKLSYSPDRLLRKYRAWPVDTLSGTHDQFTQDVGPYVP